MSQKSTLPPPPPTPLFKTNLLSTITTLLEQKTTPLFSGRTDEILIQTIVNVIDYSYISTLPGSTTLTVQVLEDNLCPYVGEEEGKRIVKGVWKVLCDFGKAPKIKKIKGAAGGDGGNGGNNATVERVGDGLISGIVEEIKRKRNANGASAIAGASENVLDDANVNMNSEEKVIKGKSRWGDSKRSADADADVSSSNFTFTPPPTSTNTNTNNATSTQSIKDDPIKPKAGVEETEAEPGVVAAVQSEDKPSAVNVESKDEEGVDVIADATGAVDSDLREPEVTLKAETTTATATATAKSFIHPSRLLAINKLLVDQSKVEEKGDNYDNYDDDEEEEEEGGSDYDSHDDFKDDNDNNKGDMTEKEAESSPENEAEDKNENDANPADDANGTATATATATTKSVHVNGRRSGDSITTTATGEVIRTQSLSSEPTMKQKREVKRAHMLQERVQVKMDEQRQKKGDASREERRFGRGNRKYAEEGCGYYGFCTEESLAKDGYVHGGGGGEGGGKGSKYDKGSDLWVEVEERKFLERKAKREERNREGGGDDGDGDATEKGEDSTTAGVKVDNRSKPRNNNYGNNNNKAKKPHNKKAHQQPYEKPDGKRKRSRADDDP